MRGRKLYFDVTLTEGNPSARFPLTEIEGNPGDRYGAFLDTMAPALGTSATDEKQAREVMAWFQPQGPVVGGFNFLTNINGDAQPPRRAVFHGPDGFLGPIVLVFDEVPNQATAILGSSVILDCSREDMQFSLDFDGTTILIHLDGPGPPDDWYDLGMDLAIGLTIDLQDMEGDPLANPGVVAEYEWVNI
jgi:hypothetical protein